MEIALMREVSRNISQCEITTVSRKPIDPVEAMAEHENYQKVLSSLGYKVHLIDADDDLPDSVFIEDAALVLPETAIITNPGAASRREEGKAVAEALYAYRELAYIGDTGTLEGGDVLRIGKTLYVGRSSRTSTVGIMLLREIVEPLGYTVTSVPFSRCLHLRAAVSKVAPNTLLINPEWVDPAVLPDMDILEVDPSEPYAANALMVNQDLVCSVSYPKTTAMLKDRGISVTSIDISELTKAEGNISCCCITFTL